MSDMISRSAVLKRLLIKCRAERVMHTTSLEKVIVFEKMRDLAIKVVRDVPEFKIDGNTSDGYHTFNELYDHRAKLFSVIVRNYPDLCWKSKLHHDGTMFDGMFIVGINTPQGQASYHYDIDQHWDMFNCREMERAPEWDGHTPSEAIDRIAALDAVQVVHCRDCQWCDLNACSNGHWCLKYRICVSEDHFCAKGVKVEGESNESERSAR